MPEQVEPATSDPCAYRETWLFEVSAVDAVRLLSGQVITGP
jgi:hypothetical protein